MMFIIRLIAVFSVVVLGAFWMWVVLGDEIDDMPFKGL